MATTDGAWAELAPSSEAVGRHLEELRALDVELELDPGDSIQAQAANIRTLRAEYARLNQAQADYTRIHGESSDRIADRQAPLKDQLGESWERIGDDAMAMFQTMTQAAAMFADAAANYASIATNEIVSQTQDEMDARADYTASLEEQLAEIEREISETTDAEAKARLESEKALMEGRIAASEEGTEVLRAQRQEEINKAFREQQNYQIAATAMNTATAIMQAYASLPTPAAIVMSAAIVAMGASQVAMIQAQEPPSAHLGGMVGTQSDERMIKARAGEGVLTAQGVAAIGGPQGVANANAGTGGANGPIGVQQVYNHRGLDTVLSDAISRGGPISTAINRRNRRGRRNPYRRAS